MKTAAFGTEFRSRSEARLAYILNDYNIEWVYEPMSFLLPNGDVYLPDFFLPKIKTIIEYRGYETLKGENQIKEFGDLICRGRVGYNGVKLVSLKSSPFPDEKPSDEIANEDPYELEIWLKRKKEWEALKMGSGDLKYIAIQPEKIRYIQSLNSSWYEGLCIDTTYIAKCPTCEQYSFICIEGSYACSFCGEHYGDALMHNSALLLPDRTNVLTYSNKCDKNSAMRII